MQRLMIAAFVVLLSGCIDIPPAPEMVWGKKGARYTEQDFMRDKYVCLKDAQQTVASGQANPYYGSSQAQVVTNSSLFNACMNAHGWFLEPKKP